MIVTKIHGHSSIHTDITQLEEELVQITIVNPTSIGGRDLRQVSFIFESETYLIHSNHDIPFIHQAQTPMRALWHRHNQIHNLC
jgi:hypothetical protein